MTTVGYIYDIHIFNIYYFQSIYSPVLFYLQIIKKEYWKRGRPRNISLFPPKKANMDTAEFIMSSSPNNISTSADIATKSTTTTILPASTASNIIKETVAKYSGIKRPQLINAHNYHHHYLSPLHLHVGPDNGPELQAVHKEAYPTAIFYVTTILALYACGLLIILIHYMNSYYGKWAWSLNDVWDELK